QIRLDYKGEVWLVAGDYKLEDEGISTSFEHIKCHSFISECTFGVPVYSCTPHQEIFDNISIWWRTNHLEGKTSVLVGYSLGKAQRILQNLDLSIGKIYTHGVIQNTNEALIRNGIDLNPTQKITPEISKEEIRGNMVLCPPSALGTPW